MKVLEGGLGAEGVHLEELRVQGLGFWVHGRGSLFACCGLGFLIARERLKRLRFSL